MSELRILTIDDPEQLKILRTKARKVLKVTPSLVALVGQMLEMMHEVNGVGLAALQVEMLQRFFVAELPKDEEAGEPAQTYILFNPEIVKGRGEDIGYEGCLSIPGYVGEVARQESVVVQALDERGHPVRLRAEGYLARVFQHEIDHLDGVLYIDKLTDSATLHPVEVGREEAAEMEMAAV